MEEYTDPWRQVEQRLDLESAMATLTQKQKRAVVLLLVGMNQEEAAGILGITQHAYHYRLKRAFEHMDSTLTKT